VAIERSSKEFSQVDKKTTTKADEKTMLDAVPIKSTMIVTAYESRDLQPDQLAQVETIQRAGAAMMQLVEHNCPGCADRSAAMRKIREAVWTATSAIATQGKSA